MSGAPAPSPSYRSATRRRVGASVGAALLAAFVLVLVLAKQEVPLTLDHGTVDPALLQPAGQADTP